MGQVAAGSNKGSSRCALGMVKLMTLVKQVVCIAFSLQCLTLAMECMWAAQPV